MPTLENGRNALGITGLEAVSSTNGRAADPLSLCEIPRLPEVSITKITATNGKIRAFIHAPFQHVALSYLWLSAQLMDSRVQPQASPPKTLFVAKDNNFSRTLASYFAGVKQPCCVPPLALPSYCSCLWRL
jgi:hypothetical protein